MLLLRWQDHYSKECTVKAAHIHKGWVVVEDGQQKLADGNYIPRGRGSAAARVEEYWQKKGAVGQHLNEAFYGGAPEDEFDMLRDEVRTLRVKLNQVTSGGQSFTQSTPTPMVQMHAQAHSYANQAAPAPPVNMAELGRTVFNMMRASSSMQDQIRGAAGAGFLKTPRREARVNSNNQRPLEGDKPENQSKERQEGQQELPYRFVRPVGSGARTLPASESKAERRYLEDPKKSYELKAPIQRDGLAEDMLERINNTEVTVKLKDLFGMSKDLREGEKLRLTRIRQPLKEESNEKKSAEVVEVEQQETVDLARQDSQECSSPWLGQREFQRGR
ncbi:hypothetical protein B0H13DRAFT_1904610 [Mycena leptocephala]|nr:hypothetical protein B0H13DRAFT_1904610 [Mycena leptocephala]